ncbi:MAG: DUF1272 domain-containing protein [Nitrospira sp.]|nr:DUF1272 domain-containing protein [Nitrospira sp.]
MLEMRPTCAHCNKALPPNSRDTSIRSYERTFCASTCKISREVTYARSSWVASFAYESANITGINSVSIIPAMIDANQITKITMSPMTVPFPSFVSSRFVQRGHERRCSKFRHGIRSPRSAAMHSHHRCNVAHYKDDGEELPCLGVWFS